MKIAIFIDNENILGVDCRNPEHGNPGIGGTEYCILLLAQVYKKAYPSDEVVLFATKQGMLPKTDAVEIVSGPMEIGKIFKKTQADMLLISAVYHGEPLSQEFFKMIEANQIKTILWGHNFYLSDFCNKISEYSYVKANVFVGRQQYDRYVDHKVIKKSTYIYNMYPQPVYEARKENSNHTVTYIGSLVPLKGFHVLAQAWKSILTEVPDAELNVIGSGKLYGRNSKLGGYGIADEEYERQFMPGLTEIDGSIMPSVHFLGVLGAEKAEVIQKTCVGVVNPTGRTETFGISALDFESLGVPVVTIGKGGFLDTVIDKNTGLLYWKINKLAENVVKLLKDREKNNQYGTAGIQLSKFFEPQKIIEQWHELFEMVSQDKKPTYKVPTSFMETNLKKYRVFNRKIKDICGIEYPLSVIGAETTARKILGRLRK